MQRALSAIAAAAVLAGPAAPASALTQAVAKAIPLGQHSSPPVPDHATSGVVRAVNANRLVIAREGKDPSEMTFEIRASTVRQGSIAVGASVEVRYRTEGRRRVATAIVAARSRTGAQKSSYWNN